ncbi:MAG: UDP-4-amino-4,6-dideoxy-N-acetyl-beta-L-altrosamine transaminase [Flavobacteriales bacterium]|nr:UDP-4-amino-4,6-dideoxy-N-acetyl-beta-L-altrosamine transaminase [Flavobacteriales bacterium]
MSQYSIPYGRQDIQQADIDSVVETLKSDFLTQGPKIHEFEKNFSEYIGSKYAVAVANGTAALHLSCLALGLKHGERVITSPITFSASANSALYCGAEVFFADINPNTYTLSIESVQKLIANKPKGFFSGIIPVDFAGFPVNTEKLRELAKEHDLWILEDACHAPGAYFTNSNNEKIKSGSGTYADLAIFSFHPVKHIACGEGGMITTNDKKLYEKLNILRTHGITKSELIKNIPNANQQGSWYYEMQALGYNYRLTDIQAALGISQLTRAESGLERRNNIANRYRDAFKDVNIKCQRIIEGVYNAHHLFVIQVQNRLGLYNHLRENGIFAQVHYIPVHLMPYYQDLGWKAGDFPNAENYYEHCISLPMFPTLKDEEQEFVIEKVLEFVN